MKEMTAILLILIAVIGIISIIIVKLYYREKEKDNDKEKLEEFINSTRSDYDDEKRRRVRRSPNRTRANLSEAQLYANTIDDVENGEMGSTTALLRQRAKSMEDAPKKQPRRTKKPNKVVPKKVNRTPERVKTQINKEEEVKSFQEPIKPEHTATINSARQEEKQPEARQVPMTEKQKEFIASEAKKLVVEDGEGSVKVVKSVKPAETIEEMKESAKIEEEIVKKAEADTAELIKRIEEAKGDVEKLADTKAEAKKEADIKEEAETAKEEAETPNIESTIEKIKQASEAKEETKAETAIETKVKEEAKAEVEKEDSQRSDDVYYDDLHILLNKDEKVEVDESPENDFVTINSGEEERLSTGNELINNAIKSIRNFRKANVPKEPVIVETKDDIVPDDYAQDLGDGIEYIGDTITITPIHEEERDLASTQPNEDVDKIYKEINKESYNKTEDEELSDSFDDVTDETSEKDANVYTKEDYKKIEAKEREKERRAQNTKKILGSKGISEEELRKRSEAKAKSKRTRKAAPAKEPVEEGQKRLMMHKAKTDVEEVYINGTLFELKVGQIVIFDINGESYSSQILRLKPGYIGVRYRSKKIWVKSNTVKKILK